MKSPLHLAACALLLVPGWFLSGCGEKSRLRSAADSGADREDAIHSQPLHPQGEGKETTVFHLLTPEETGIDLVHRFPEEAPFKMMTDQSSGCGVCLGDVDGDHLPDVYLTNYDKGNRLYRNLGQWRFADVTDVAGVGGEGRWCGGASFADIDNDGDLDLYVCVYNAPNLLYINRGDGSFDERAAEAGLAFAGASVMMAFADYDLDGDLDGYLVTHRLKSGDAHRLPKSTRDALDRGILTRTGPRGVGVAPDYRELFQLHEKGGGRHELVIAGQQDYLYRQDGDGKFTSVNAEAGVSGFGIGLAATWWDYDGDRYPDLYVSNDYKGADQLYHNNGNGAFTDVTRVALPHVPWFSMGADVADINNDGRMDLLASDMSGRSHFTQKVAMGDMVKNRWFLERADPQQYMRNAVYLNTGTERFMEVAYLTGLANTDWTWSPKFGDFDNDGWEDLFVTNGMSRDFMNSDLGGKAKGRRDEGWRDKPVLKQVNLALRNLGGLAFEDAGERWGLNHDSASFGAALSDLDRDGDLDIVCMNLGAPPSVWRNDTTSRGILIRLSGQISNRWGIGATVKLATQSGIQTRQLTLARGFMSANEPLLHFGLGRAPAVERLTIIWPSGVNQRFENLNSGRFYTVTESPSSDIEATADPVPTGSAWFRELPLASGIRHEERPFDDFALQPLLPKRLSRSGPGLAVGDADGDGRDDIYIGGAAGQAGALVLMGTRPRLIRTPFARDAECEDLGVLFFDADGDGDQDLYVVSGGVEAAAGHAALEDRLYLNEGSGAFVRAPGDRLPGLRDSGSAVAAADYDRDGDLDLFVGGRVIPGRYPLSPASRLLRNEEGSFKDVTEALAPELLLCGRVTAALWSDADGDGWIDLLVTQEWGPVRLYGNAEGKFMERTEGAGLGDRSGWWGGIAAGDVDGDGHMDYAVTNAGLNTKYKATSEHPALMYYGDFDGDARGDLVEAEYESDVLYPGRGRSCTSGALPFVGRQFPSFRQFAMATLSDIYSREALDAALRMEATTLQSGVYINDGRAHFRFAPLPRLAQASPGSGVALTDVDGDGKLDLYLVQNDFSPQPETGRMDGGLSLLLTGNGDGSFAPVWPAESGLIITGDARGLAVADVNEDGRPDFIVSRNDDAPVVFENHIAAHLLQLELRGAGGNVAAVGARVTLVFEDGSLRVGETAAGGSCLSQSTASLFFGLGPSGRDAISELVVRWPDGEESRLNALPPDGGDGKAMVLAHPRRKRGS